MSLTDPLLPTCALHKVGRLVSWGTPDVPLVLSAQPLVTLTGPRSFQDCADASGQPDQSAIWLMTHENTFTHTDIDFRERRPKMSNLG
jgi:hypothetical protein